MRSAGPQVRRAISRSHVPVNVRGVARAPLEQDQLRRVLDRQRPQHYRVDQAVNGSVCADAQCQCENGHRRRARRFRDHGEAVTNVLPELDPCHVAELSHSRVACFLRRHAAFDVVLRLPCNVVADILVEFLQHAFAAAHDLPPCFAGRRIRAIAPASLSHLPVSSVSCRRPLAVRR